MVEKKRMSKSRRRSSKRKVSKSRRRSSKRRVSKSHRRSSKRRESRRKQHGGVYTGEPKVNNFFEFMKKIKKGTYDKKPADVMTAINMVEDIKTEYYKNPDTYIPSNAEEDVAKDWKDSQVRKKMLKIFNDTYPTVRAMGSSKGRGKIKKAILNDVGKRY